MLAQKEIVQILEAKLGSNYYLPDKTGRILGIAGLGAYLYHTLEESEKVKAELTVVKDAMNQLKEEFESCFLALEQAKEALQQRCLHTSVTQVVSLDISSPSK